ncbi:MAG: RimK/LysX family protein [Candidatus Diapherotrites archaeon]|nr:RimK/LysX family protein [Candidatus Diapherotrites archaeon]
MSKKKIIGLVEIVKIRGRKGTVKKRALFDTGATRTCLDVKIAAKAGVGPIVSSVKVKSASSHRGYTRRAIAEATIIVKGKVIKTGVNIEDREGLPYPIIIGRDIIHNNFIIDVSRTHNTNKVGDSKDESERKRFLEEAK